MSANHIVSPELIVSLYHVHGLRPAAGHAHIQEDVFFGKSCCAMGVLQMLIGNMSAEEHMKWSPTAGQQNVVSAMLPWQYGCGLTAGFDGYSIGTETDGAYCAGHSNGVAIRAACILAFGEF